MELNGILEECVTYPNTMQQVIVEYSVVGWKTMCDLVYVAHAAGYSKELVKQVHQYQHQERYEKSEETAAIVNAKFQ